VLTSNDKIGAIWRFQWCMA